MAQPQRRGVRRQAASIRKRREAVVTVDLEHPVNVNGKPQTEIGLARPTLGDLEDVEGLPALASMVQLVTILSGWPKDSVRELSATDFGEVNLVLRDFLPKESEEDSSDEEETEDSEESEN